MILILKRMTMMMKIFKMILKESVRKTINAELGTMILVLLLPAKKTKKMTQTIMKMHTEVKMKKKKSQVKVW